MAVVTITFTDAPDDPVTPVHLVLKGENFDPEAPPEEMTPAQNVAISVLSGILKYSAALADATVQTVMTQ